MNGKNRIMIFGPKDDGTYVVEFRTAAGKALAISIPRSEAAVIRYFQDRMPYRLFGLQLACPPIGVIIPAAAGLYHEDRTPTHGYEATREAAMQAFAKSWHRET
jgi:hypothetical protein